MGEAGDGETAVSQARVLKPDVVLMDIRMPRLDGVEATRRIVSERGGEGPAEHLVDAVHVVAAGDAVVAPRVTKRLLDRFAQHLPATTVPGSPDVSGLTDRERDVLLLVARGLSNSEIAARLVVGETTVKTPVSNVLGKLGLRDRVQAVVYAYENGLV